MFARTNQDLPRLLSELRSLPGQTEQGEVLDGWKHPFAYSVTGTNCTILSYGRDGKPGGFGLDCDLSNQGLRPPESLITLKQFLFEMPEVRGMIFASAMAGMLTVILSFFIIRPKDFIGGGTPHMVFKLVITLLAALLVASVMTALHIPSGH